uniref:Uncharacterized protein n=1 Tax=Cacopsylla melanoneura TaxID=428564 RepID=A0A8D8XB31_9HEMI
MKLKKSNKNFSIINFDEYGTNTKKEKTSRHGPFLPSFCLGLLIGPSACGKTNLMLNLLIDENGLKFENLYVYSNTLFQPKYQLIQNIFCPLKCVRCFFYASQNDIILPKHMTKNSVMIFDDVITEKNQQIMMSYFAMGRHKNVDVFYLAQSYVKVPKSFIRCNANLLILFKQDDVNLKHIYEEHVSTDMSLKEFKNVCHSCWLEKHSFLVINKESELNSGRYRKGFDTIITSFA